MSITSDFEVGCHKFNFVRLDKPDNIVAWKLGRDWEGWNYDRLGIIKATNLTSDILKRLNVWEKLDDNVRSEMERIESDVNYVINTRMEKARNSRQKRYPNVPEEIACIECGQTIKIQPGLLVKRAEKWANGNVTLTVFDFIKQFRCQSCHCTKGRKSKTGLPPKIELVCKCGFKVSYPASVVKKTIDKKGITLEDYVKNYRCQKCNPTIGRQKGKRGRKKSK